MELDLEHIEARAYHFEENRLDERKTDSPTRITTRIYIIHPPKTSNMVDADDVQGYGTKLQNQLDKLEDAEIDERDRDEINRWITHLRVHESINEGTVVGHFNRLRLSAERATTPLVEMDKAAVDEFMLTLEDEHGLSEGSRRNYRKSLRRFFNDHLDREWGEEITIGASLKRQVDPDDALSRGEISEILKEASNPRDKALIAVLADTGLRVGAVLSFQMRHVSIDGDQATLTINDEANVKGDDGPKPVVARVRRQLDRRPSSTRRSERRPSVVKPFSCTMGHPHARNPHGILRSDDVDDSHHAHVARTRTSHLFSIETTIVPAACRHLPNINQHRHCPSSSSLVETFRSYVELRKDDLI